MKILELTLIASFVLHVYSQLDSTQQVTLSCPARPERNRDPLWSLVNAEVRVNQKTEIRSNNMSFHNVLAICLSLVWAGEQFASLSNFFKINLRLRNAFA